MIYALNGILIKTGYLIPFYFLNSSVNNSIYDLPGATSE